MYLFMMAIILSGFSTSHAAVADYSKHFRDLGYIHSKKIELTPQQSQSILKLLGLFSTRLNPSMTVSNVINLVHEIRINLTPLTDSALGIHELTEYIFEISGPLKVMPYTKKASQYIGFFDSLLKYIHYICDLMGIDTRLPLNVTEDRVEVLSNIAPSHEDMDKYLAIIQIRKLVKSIYSRQLSLKTEANSNPQSQINPLKTTILSEIKKEKLLNGDLVIKQKDKDYLKPDFLNED